MRLLLLLSALLAALSGAGVGARAPQHHAAAVSARAAAPAVAPAHAHVLARSPQAFSRRTPLAVTAPAAVLLPAPRLWATRRRE